MTDFLRVRKIGIDVLPFSEPFISLSIEKVITDTEGNTVQVVGGYDRIYRRLSDIASQPMQVIADDGLIDGLEIYQIVATAAYGWVIEKHGGTFIDGKLVIS